MSISKNNVSRFVRIAAIFMVGLLTSACGGEDMMNDEYEYGSEAYHLQSDDRREMDHSGDYDEVDEPEALEIDETDELQIDQGRRLDALRFDPQRHRIENTTEIENKLNLERIQRFGFDCEDGSQHCAPATEYGAGETHSRSNLEDACADVTCEDDHVCIAGECLPG